jgi:hypothetical protein
MALNIAATQRLVPNAFDLVSQGFSEGTVRRQDREQEALIAQQRQEQQAKAQRVQQDLGELFNNPNAGSVDRARFLATHPDVAKQFLKPFELMDKAEADEMKRQGINVFAALKTGNVDVAKELLERQQLAAENSGDDRRAAGAKAMLLMLEQNPEIAKTATALTLQAVMGDDFSKIDAQLSEDALVKRTQEATEDRALADLNLTKEQTSKLKADTKGLEVDTKKAIFELEALKQGNQPIEPEKKFSLEKQLRDEFNKRTANSTEIEDAFRTVESAEDTAAGDMALIFAFMKMLDPGSTVREGEFATAQNTTGIPGRITNAYNRALTGGRLNKDQKKEFTAQAKSTLKASQKRIKEVRADLSLPVKNYGLNPDNVFGAGELQAAPDRGELSAEELAGMTNEQRLARIAELESQ